MAHGVCWHGLRVPSIPPAHFLDLCSSDGAGVESALGRDRLTGSQSQGQLWSPLVRFTWLYEAPPGLIRACLDPPPLHTYRAGLTLVGSSEELNLGANSGWVLHDSGDLGMVGTGQGQVHCTEKGVSLEVDSRSPKCWPHTSFRWRDDPGSGPSSDCLPTPRPAKGMEELPWHGTHCEEWLWVPGMD